MTEAQSAESTPSPVRGLLADTIAVQTGSVAPTQRRRRPRACDSCWQRKIRCDESSDSCRNCQIYGIACTTTRADGSAIVRIQLSHPAHAQSIQKARVQKRKRRSEAATDHIPYTNNESTSRPLESSNVRDYTNGNEHVREVTAVRTTSDSPPPNAFTPIMTPASGENSSEPGLEGVVMIESAQDPWRCKYSGKSSTQVLAKSAEELFRDRGIRLNVMKFYSPLLRVSEEIRMPVRDLVPLMEKSVAVQYVDAFFSTIHQTFPFIEETIFYKDVEIFYREGHSQNVPNTCCIYLVMAIGARSCTATVDSETLFSAVWSLYEVLIASPYLSSIQAFILMTLELINCNKEGQAIISIGAAIRIAQSLGLHRALSTHKLLQERQFVEKNYHLRSCVWWTCYCLDKKLCFEQGRPSIVNDIDCDVDLISLSHAEAPSPEGFPTRRPYLAVFEHLVQLCQILSTIMSRLFSKNVEPRDEPRLLEQIQSMDDMLLDWKRALPRDLATDIEMAGINVDSSTVGSMLLHCMYYNAMLVIHRAALFGPLSASIKHHGNRRMASAEAICLNAARSLAKCVNELASTPASWPIIRWTTPYPFNVMFTLYIGVMRNPLQWTYESDVALMRSMSRCFTRSNTNSDASKSFEELVESLENGIKIAVGQKRENGRVSASTGRQVRMRPTGQHDSMLPDHLENAAANGGEPMWDEDSIPWDVNYHFQDFFGFAGDAEPGNSMQLWPINLDPSRDAALS